MRNRKVGVDSRVIVVVGLLVSLCGTLAAQTPMSEMADGMGAFEQWVSYDRTTQCYLIVGIQAGAFAIALRQAREDGVQWDKYPSIVAMDTGWGVYKMAEFIDMVYRKVEYQWVPYAWIIIEPKKWLAIIGG